MRTPRKLPLGFQCLQLYSENAVYKYRVKVVLSGIGGRADTVPKAEKVPNQVNADKFDGILKRLIEHKPVPKKKVKASRKKKLGSVLGT
jgi:hypothetical protein